MRPGYILYGVIICVVAAALAVTSCGRVGFDSLASDSTDANGDPIDSGRTADDGDVLSDSGVVTACVDEVCDLFPQCGCDEDQKCQADLVGARSCGPAGDSGHAQVCRGLNAGDCRAGTSCLHQDDWPADTNLCLQFCATHADCKDLGPGGLCALSARSSNGELLYNLCTVACDPIEKIGCPSGTMCSIYNFDETAGTNCTKIGKVDGGQSCKVHFDCTPGNFCVNATCRPVCFVKGDETCPSNTVCTGTGLMSRDRELGACLAPDLPTP